MTDLIIYTVLVLAVGYCAGRARGKRIGYEAGKTDGIVDGWRRGWTQPRLPNGRYIGRARPRW